MIRVITAIFLSFIVTSCFPKKSATGSKMTSESPDSQDDEETDSPKEEPVKQEDSNSSDSTNIKLTFSGTGRAGKIVDKIVNGQKNFLGLPTNIPDLKLSGSNLEDLKVIVPHGKTAKKYWGVTYAGSILHVATRNANYGFINGTDYDLSLKATSPRLKEAGEYITIELLIDGVKPEDRLYIIRPKGSKALK